MKHKFSQRYQGALLAFLKRTPGSGIAAARGLGSEALAAGCGTLDLAKLHEQILLTHALPGRTKSERASVIRRAGAFFTEAIIPSASVRRAAPKAGRHFNAIVAMLSQRTVELAASNVELEQEIIQRRVVEEALKKSERHYATLLQRSDLLQEQLRQLSRQILSAQEDERKKISRELHDVIAQTLTGINLRLATLKKEASFNTKGLARNIDRTQKLVVRSVNLVHQFARELRPAVLDDLGLLPALQAFMKSFTERTGVRVYLTSFAGIEELEAAKRTALFRVAQEALTNVARHARATRVEVSIEKLPGGIGLKIRDDGKSFAVGAQRGKGRKRLGLLGMKERMEMVGGSLDVTSAVGAGTTVWARVPNDSRPSRPAKRDKSK